MCVGDIGCVVELWGVVFECVGGEGGCERAGRGGIDVVVGGDVEGDDCDVVVRGCGWIDVMG